MKLTESTIERLKSVPLYKTDGMKYREVLAVFYHMFSRWTWYIVEAEPQDDGDWLMFGYVKSGLGEDCDEWGYVLYSQLNEIPAIEYYVPDAMQITNEGIILE